MSLWEWIKNRLARLRSWLRIAGFFLRAEGTRLATRIFRRNSAGDPRLQTDYESVAEAMASADWPFLRQIAQSHPDFPNQPDPLMGLPWFHTAIELATPEVIQWMIGLGADLNHYDMRSYCPLNYATMRDDDLAIVLQMLIGAGAKVGSANTVGATPLHFAASLGVSEAVEVLIDHGADPQARDSDNPPMTPADAARFAGYPDLADRIDAGRLFSDA